jgi:hypothetical protein
MKWALALGCAVAAPIGSAGCGDPAIDREDARSGALSVPLVTVVNGHTYRLKNAVINVSGPTYAWLQSSDDPAETRLSASLLAGSYSAGLIQWTLERDDGSGTFWPVRAMLSSDATVFFDIFAGATTSISYRFETDADIVVIGSGDLRVSISVGETTPACTPFGNGCSAGTWCAPSALTGRALSCIAEGTIALGSSCLSPNECVRNASCFDLGAGPVCVALCPSSDVGAPCITGGTCREAGPGYGVCRP